jgi:hypothetical protein
MFASIFSLDNKSIEKIKDITETICREFYVNGLINIQFAVKTKKYTL